MTESFKKKCTAFRITENAFVDENNDEIPPFAICRVRWARNRSLRLNIYF